MWNRAVRGALPLVLITLLAAALRLFALATLPPGLYHDEAFNGLDALDVLGGNTPIFFVANNGREPLFIYLSALSVAVFGRSPGALRLVSALLGILTIPAVYALARELFGRPVANLAAFLAATTVWTLNLSRVAFRVGSLVPVLAAALALLWSGLRRRSLVRLACAGALYGLSFYTYLAARFTPIALLLTLIYLWLWHRDWLWLRGWLVFVAVALVVVAPLGWYFAQHWGETLTRAGQVSIWNPDINRGDLLGLLARQVARALRAFWYSGDFIPRHNVPWRAFFDPLIGAAFAVGLLVALVRSRRIAACGLALIWLGVMLVPTILAEGAPHMLRAAGILPVLFVFPALGLVALWRALPARWRRWRPPALALILALSAASNVSAYDQHLHSEAVYYEFEAGATQLAVEANRFLGVGWQGQGLSVSPATPQPNHAVLLAGRLWDGWTSLPYLIPLSANLHVLGSVAQVEPSVPDLGAATDVLLLVWPYEDNSAALDLLPHERVISVREGARERGDLEAESRLLYLAYETQSPQVAPHNVDARWEQGITLLGYRVQQVGSQEILVELYWRAEQPLAAGYTAFVHVVGDGGLLGQHDGPTANGYYPTESWRSGDIVVDRHRVALSVPWDPASCRLIVGLYRLETMEHLRLLAPSDDPTQLVLP